MSASRSSFPQRILVTGGAGFIGSHLVQRKLEQGHVVEVIDDLSTGSLANLAEVTSDSKLASAFTFHRSSLEEKRDLEAVVERCDQVFHLAAAVGVKKVMAAPLSSFAVNTESTKRLLYLAAKYQKKLFYASSSEVYGKSAQTPLSEEGDLLYGPSTKLRWSYGVGKLIGEYQAHIFAQELGVPMVIGRLFNTVGRRQSADYGMVLPRFVVCALSGQPIEIYGDGQQTRCFTHVSDVVHAMDQLINLPDLAQRGGVVVNIGSEREISILELAQLVRQRSNSRSELTFTPYERAYSLHFEDIPRRVPCLKRLRQLLAFRAQVSLEEVIDEVIAERRVLRLNNKPQHLEECQRASP